MYAISQVVTAYKDNYSGEDKIKDDILTILKKMIDSYAYIDDLSLFSTGRGVTKFMMKMKDNSFICDYPGIMRQISD